VDYIGQFFNFEFNLNLFDPQGNMILNQTWNVTPQVACAYYPNDITGFPEFLPTGSEGYDSPRYILPGHEVLFVVRFQNTGNYPAEDVKIDIPLDPTKWDIGEFSPLHASALDMGCLHDDGTYDLIVDSNQVVIKFVFEDIYLPDSVSNEEASHGFAAFRIKARNDLAHNTELNAQAFIYFDENPAVVTNQTLHTIFDCESFSSIVGQDVVCASDSISLDATQPFVDTFTWVLNNEVVSTASTFSYPAETGNYSVVLTTSNALCDIPGDSYGPEVHAYSVVVNPLPSAEVTTDGGVLTAVDGVAWQWSIDGIADVTTPSIVASQNGMYTVEITNEFGCSVVSDSLAITSGINNIQLQASINVYPNPMNAQARIELPQGLFDIEIFDQTGACVRSLPNSQGVVIVERASLVTGIYHLQIRSEEGKQHIRLVVE
jgi:hypothetical protein